MSRATSADGALAALNGFARERVGGGGRVSPFGSKARAVAAMRRRATRLDAPGLGGGDSIGRDLRAVARDMAPGGVAPERAEAVRVPAPKEVAR